LGGGRDLVVRTPVHGESYGREAQILRNPELFAAHGAFVTKAEAAQWGEQHKAAQRGFLECQVGT